MTIRLIAQLVTLAWLIVFVVVPLSADDVHPPSWTMPDADRQALLALVERAIHDGFPDAKGGKLYQGTLTLSSAKPKSPAANPGAEQEPKEFAGIHLKLADGTWMVCLKYSLAGAVDVTVDDKKVVELPFDQIASRADQALARNGSMEQFHTSQTEWAKHFVPEQQAVIIALEKAYGLMTLCQQDGELDDVGTLCAVLLRLGIPHAEDLAVCLAMQALWEEDASSINSGTVSRLHLLPEDMDEVRTRFEGSKSTNLRLPEEVPLLRRQLAFYFYQQLILSDNAPELQIHIDRTAVANAVLDLVDETAQPIMRAELAKLEERNGLPWTTAAKAELATRLASWVPDVQSPDMGIGGSDNVAPNTDPNPLLPPSSDQQTVPPFTEAEIGSLVALTGDRRPSRWLDDMHFRTLGDNALRALAEVLGFDPRLLIKRDQEAPWTDSERDAVASALAEWWRENHDKSIAAIRESIITFIPLPQLADLMGRMPVPQRDNFITHLASIWQTKPPTDPDPHYLATILSSGRSSVPLIKVTSTFPIMGKAAILLAAWHLEHGDNQPFETMFSTELKNEIGKAVGDAGVKQDSTGTSGNNSDAEPKPILGTLAIIAFHHPNLERLQRLLEILAGSPDSMAYHEVYNSLETGSGEMIRYDIQHLWDGPVEEGVSVPKQGVAANDRAVLALPIAIMATLLKDRRPAPEWMKSEFNESPLRAQYPNTNQNTAGKPLATDLRVKDFAAWAFCSGALGQTYAQLESASKKDDQEDLTRLMVDLTGMRAERDGVIQNIRHLIGPVLTTTLAAAEVPAAFPGLTEIDKEGDANATF